MYPYQIRPIILVHIRSPADEKSPKTKKTKKEVSLKTDGEECVGDVLTIYDGLCSETETKGEHKSQQHQLHSVSSILVV